MSNFHSLEVVGRGSATQLQVGENLTIQRYIITAILTIKVNIMDFSNGINMLLFITNPSGCKFRFN